MPPKPPREPPRLPAWARRDDDGPVRPLWGEARGGPAPPAELPSAEGVGASAPVKPEDAQAPGAAASSAEDTAATAPSGAAPQTSTVQAGPPTAERAPAAGCPRCEETQRRADEQVAVYAQGLGQAVGNLARASVELGMRLNLDAITLARKLAERVIQRAVELDERLVLANLRRAMEAAGPVERLTLRCAERDLALLREEAAAAAAQGAGHPVEVVVQASPDLTPGSLFLLFEEGLVDARLGTQLDRLTAAVEDAVSLGALAKGPREGAEAPAPEPPEEAAP